MEDVISLTPKQLSGLVYHLNEELYRYSVHNDDSRRIVTTRILNMCVNCYNSPNIKITEKLLRFRNGTVYSACWL